MTKTTNKLAAWNEAISTGAPIDAEDGFLKLETVSISAAQSVIDRGVDLYKQLRGHIPEMLGIMAWIKSNPQQEPQEPMPFKTICDDLDLDAEAMSETMMRNIPVAFRCMLEQETGFSCPFILNRLCGEKPCESKL